MEEAAGLLELAQLLHTPVHEIVDDMPAQELMMWQEWLREPRGDRRADWRSATVCRTIHDVALGFNGAKNDQPLSTYLIAFKETSGPDAVQRNVSAARQIFGKVVPKC
jgi:hypothetical protein